MNPTPAPQGLTDEEIIYFARHAADRIPLSNYEGRVLHAVRMAESRLASTSPAQTGGVDQAWVKARIAEWLDEAIDWDAAGTPLTRRMCISYQCGPLALNYIESLSTALGAGNANSDSVHLTSVSDKAPTVSENKEFQCK